MKKHNADTSAGARSRARQVRPTKRVGRTAQLESTEKGKDPSQREGQQPLPPKTPGRIPKWIGEFVYVAQLKRLVSRKTGQMFDKDQFTDLFGFLKIEGHKKRVPAATFFLHWGLGVK